MDDAISIGIIGGSGLYAMPELDNREEIAIRTPFGATSDALIKGTIAGVPVVFIPRHGRGHVLTPTEVPYAANIYALKSLGVKFIISVSACGSLREDFAPGHICIPDQVVDNTREARRRTFFGDGIVAHVGVGNPFCPELNDVLYNAANSVGATTHHGGTFITIEGPRFSTRAESETYRQLGYSIIGMTTATEAFLAAEAEIAYSVFAHITDYDVWHATEADVSVEMVVQTFQKNLQVAQQAIVQAVPKIVDLPQDLPAHNTLAGAIMTSRQHLPPATLDKLRLLIGRYVS